MPIDVAGLTIERLRNLLRNAERLGHSEIAQTAMVELARRGKATSADYRLFAWNQDRVRTTMEPFRLIAAEVESNQRTAYTQAGGEKIGKRKTDPAWVWVDTYSAIKTNEVNAAFSCQIKRPGDDPVFILIVDRQVTASFNADGLPEALNRWRQLAAQARTQEVS